MGVSWVDGGYNLEEKKWEKINFWKIEWTIDRHTLSGFIAKLVGGGCKSRVNKLAARVELAFSAANCSLISANNANESCDGILFSCGAFVVDVDGIALSVAGDTWLLGDGVILFRVPDDMLRSTEPNGIGFDAERTNGNNGFMSNGVCECKKKKTEENILMELFIWQNCPATNCGIIVVANTR